MIECAGWVDLFRISLRFTRRGDALAYKRGRCFDVEGCRDCPVHIMLEFEQSIREQKKEEP